MIAGSTAVLLLSALENSKAPCCSDLADINHVNGVSLLCVTASFTDLSYASRLAADAAGEATRCGDPDEEWTLRATFPVDALRITGDASEMPVKN